MKLAPGAHGKHPGALSCHNPQVAASLRVESQLIDAVRTDQASTAYAAAIGDALTPELLVRHAPAVLAVCLAHTARVHDAEDVMQDVFLAAVEKLHTLRDRSRLRPWLLQIARRRCIDLYRRRVSTHSLQDDIPVDESAEDARVKCLHMALSRLPAEYRQTICLYYLDGRKCASVAESLGISKAAVRQRLARARLMLHDLLVEQKS